MNNIGFEKKDKLIKEGEMKMTKFCIICGKELTGKQKILCSDKECHRIRKKENNRIYRQNNLEKIKEYQQEYRQSNREELNKYNREYHQDNLEKMNKQNRDYYQNNLKKIKKDKFKYYREHKEKINDYYSKYYRRSRGLSEDADLHKESSIEIVVRGWLQESDVEFEQQYFINFEGKNWTRIDFYIPKMNVCLYVDGDYWHSLSEIQERDMRNNRLLEEMGYNVIRITEIEILERNKCKLMQYLS